MASMGPDTLIERAAACLLPTEIGEARAVFERATGPFGPGDPWHDERVDAFFAWLTLAWSDGDACRRLLARPSDLDAGARATLTALARSMRSLWEVRACDADGGAHLLCLLGGARLRLSPHHGHGADWTPGAIFDGRLFSDAGAIRVAPGRIVHPPAAHDALRAVLDDATRRGERDERLLDPLLRVRMRAHRYPGLHPRHLYRWDALAHEDVLAAPWRGAPAASPARST